MLKTKVFSTIADLPQGEWDKLLGDASQTYSHAFWDVIEKSKLNDFSYRYVLFFDETDTPVALTSFYSITTDMAIFATGAFKWLLNTIRRIFPNFFKLRMLECGTPITVNSPPFVTNGKIPVREVITALDALLIKTAKAEKQLLIVIRDFEPNAQLFRPEFAAHGYCWVDSLPNTYMDIIWQDPKDYLASMKSYYRSKLLRHLRKAEKRNIRHELVEDFGGIADVLCTQWLTVHNNADEFQREVLTPGFYREFSAKMGNRSKAILFYRGDELVGHVLLFMDGSLLRWLYFGRKESLNDSLYLYAGHKVVETAIMLGAKRLELGLTTYSIKQDLGAQVTPNNLALKSSIALINPLVGVFYPLLNHIPAINNRNIFKEGLDDNDGGPEMPEDDAD